METRQPTIGFIGQGYIGKNYADDFERRGYKVVRYSLEEPYVHNRGELASCDVIFIAVPTPTTPEGFDVSVVQSAIADTPAGAVVVLKSTVLPGTTERLYTLFHDRFVVYSPEFLCAATAAHDATNPFMNVIGIPRDTLAFRAIAERLLSILPPAPYQSVTHSTEAEFIKYTHNTLGYIKVVWMNMLFDALSAFGRDWKEVRRAAEHDPMISNWYNDPVHGNGRGAGGACFIKDYAAFSKLYKSLKPDDVNGHAMLDAIERKNVELLVNSNKDLDLLEGVYGGGVQSTQREDTSRRGFGRAWL